MEEFTNNLSNEERETHLNMSGDNHREWFIFTDDPFWIRRLDKFAKGEIVGKGKEYRLDVGQVTIRAKRAPMSDAQKALLAARLATAQAKSDGA